MFRVDARSRHHCVVRQYFATAAYPLARAVFPAMADRPRNPCDETHLPQSRESANAGARSRSGWRRNAPAPSRTRNSARNRRKASSAVSSTSVSGRKRSSRRSRSVAASAIVAAPAANYSSSAPSSRSKRTARPPAASTKTARTSAASSPSSSATSKRCAASAASTSSKNRSSWRKLADSQRSVSGSAWPRPRNSNSRLNAETEYSGHRDRRRAVGRRGQGQDR